MILKRIDGNFYVCNKDEIAIAYDYFDGLAYKPKSLQLIGKTLSSLEITSFNVNKKIMFTDEEEVQQREFIEEKVRRIRKRINSLAYLFELILIKKPKIFNDSAILSSFALVHDYCISARMFLGYALSEGRTNPYQEQDSKRLRGESQQSNNLLDRADKPFKMGKGSLQKKLAILRIEIQEIIREIRTLHDEVVTLSDFPKVTYFKVKHIEDADTQLHLAKGKLGYLYEFIHHRGPDKSGDKS